MRAAPGGRQGADRQREDDAEHVGAVIESGLAIDFATLKAAPLPPPALDGLPVHRICGSRGVAPIRFGDEAAIGRDPFAVLRSHHRWVDVAADRGAKLARLPVSGAYLVDSGENHSDLHGPPAAWRRSFTAQVSAVGHDLDAAAAGRFGQSLEGLHAAARRLGPAEGRAADLAHGAGASAKEN